MSANFIKELWREITPIYKAILTHPFIKGLTDGLLGEESFKFYVVQDALYLREFARSLSIAATGEINVIYRKKSGEYSSISL